MPGSDRGRWTDGVRACVRAEVSQGDAGAGAADLQAARERRLAGVRREGDEGRRQDLVSPFELSLRPLLVPLIPSASGVVWLLP